MKKGKIIGITIIAAGLLTGCIDNMPEMTEEQSALIAEYAADMLLKYSPNYNYKIADEEELVEETQEAETEAIEVTVKEITEEATQEQTIEEAVKLDEEEILDIVDATEVDFAEVFSIDGVEIRYNSIEVHSSYPKEENLNGFSVNAADGNSLIVMTFTIENTSEDLVVCDLFEKDFDISMKINQGNYKKISSTLLVNDFTTYMEEIPAGESREAVIVAETEEIAEEDITSCILRLTSDEANITVKLK